jgi:predicted nucleic acid-binding protein
MNYIIDSNVWIEYFNKKNYFDSVSELLVNNTVYINKIILAELIPSARARNETEFIECLSGIEVLDLDINWDELIEIQFQCIKNGINKLGLLDIVIAQNAKQNDSGIFTINRHMILLCNLIGVKYKTS